MPGKPRQQAPNTSFWPRPAPAAARFAHPARPRVSGETVPPPRPSMSRTVGSRWQRGRWHRPSEMETAASGPRPRRLRGRKPVATSTPTVATRRPRPAVRGQAGAAGGGSKHRSLTAPAPVRQDGAPRWAGEAPGLPGAMCPLRWPGPTASGPAIPSR